MSKLREEKGFVLVLGMLLLLVATVIGVGTVSTATHDLRISGNKRISEEVFYAAEGGIHEFMGRFRDGASGALSDSAPSSPNWRLFIASSAARAAEIGYSSGDPNHESAQSLQSQADFGVEIRHKVDLANNVINEADSPVYIATSHGYTRDGGNRVIEVEFCGVPGLDPPGALYSERPVDILGQSTYIQGKDQCTGGVNKPGIVTPLSLASNPINTSGGPDIQGEPSPIKYGYKDLDLLKAVKYLKKDANFEYDSHIIGTEHSVEQGQLDARAGKWGTPTSTDTKTPNTYPDSNQMNIVYFDMHKNGTLTLTGGSRGAGILLVNGNLQLHGGFTWYGVIIVTGALDFTGGGEKNVTGGILTGETATVTVDVGGDAGLMYCSNVGRRLKRLVFPFRTTRWRDVF